VTVDGSAAPLGAILVTIGPSQARIVLSGEVDIACAAQAEAACTVVERTCCLVVVDASRVTFLDAAGLGFLVRLRQVAKEWQMQRASEPVWRLLELTGLTHLLAPAAAEGVDVG
jgi:anti-anti-sigma factor